MDSFFSFMNMAKTAVMGSFMYIHSLYDLTDFVSNVNSGMNYSGTTVILESDIDFSTYVGDFTPIGIDEENSFMGVFDGKNHIISNLTIVTSSEYAGLFGYTQGATIKNLKLDSTCSISSISLKPDVYIGGLVGYCAVTDINECIIDGCMSAARVSFSGNTMKSYDRTGGLIGECEGTEEKGCTITNSMNYGPVKHSGLSKNSIMGGICGVCEGKNSENGKCTIYNSGTYSTIIHSGTVNEGLVMGGILGVGTNVCMENCVSACPITSGRKTRISGGIAGTLKASDITRVFWEEAQGVTGACSDKEKNVVLDGTSKNPSKFHEKTVEALNRYRDEKLGILKFGKKTLKANIEYDWVLLNMNGGSGNNITRNVFIAHRAFVPTPRKENTSFLGWCEDNLLSEKCGYSPLKSNSIGFYAKYGSNEVNENKRKEEEEKEIEVVKSEEKEEGGEVKSVIEIEEKEEKSHILGREDKKTEESHMLK